MKRIFSVSAVLVLCFLARVQAAPALPEHTVNGMTLRVIGMEWKSFQPSERGQHVLCVRFQVEAPESDSQTLTRAVRFYRLPDNADNRDWNVIKEPGVLYLRIDPRTERIPIEWQMSAPEENPEKGKSADGRFESLLEFTDLPLPSKTGAPLPINQTLATALGTQVTLERIAITPEENEGDGNYLRFVFSRSTAPAPLDLTVNFDGVQSRVYDDAGTDLSKGRYSNNLDVLDKQPDYWTLSVPAEAAPQVRKLRLLVGVSEYAPSLKATQGNRYFRFDITPPLPEIQPTNHPPQTVVEGNAALSMEGPFLNYDSYKVLFWIKDPRLASDSHREWELKSSAMKAENGAVSNSGVGRSQVFWHADGRPAAPDEQGWEISGFTFAHTPKTLAFEANLAPVRRVVSTFEFRDIPLPEPEKSLVLNRSVEDEYSHLVLREVVYFTPDEPLPDWDGGQEPLEPSSGLAVFFERLRPLGLPRDTWPPDDWAEDNQRRPLMKTQGAISFEYDVRHEEKERQGEWHIPLLLPPASDAQSFSMTTSVLSVTPEGNAFARGGGIVSAHFAPVPAPQ